MLQKNIVCWSEIYILKRNSKQGCKFIDTDTSIGAHYFIADVGKMSESIYRPKIHVKRSLFSIAPTIIARVVVVHKQPQHKK